MYFKGDYSMPRKQKNVYERINLTLERVNSLEQELKKQKEKLCVLNKEKDELEKQQMFQYAKENNMSLDDVIRALSVFNVKQQFEQQTPQKNK